jgi:hypothetical protein
MACKRRYGALTGAFVLALPALALGATPAPAPGPAIVQIGAAYVAKQLCSCVFVARREEGSCRAEFKPEIDTFTVTVDRAGLPESANVTATVGPVAAEADYATPFGCVLAK